MHPHAPVHPPRLRPRRRWALLALVGLMLALTSCTFRAGDHMTVDFLGPRYRFYVYEKPSSQLSVELHGVCGGRNGRSRKAWSTCSLDFLREHVEVPSVGRREWRVWTGADQWDDYAGAVESVIRRGFRKDARGERYARACVVGDHFGFRDYNWTFRSADDAHCKRGKNA